MDAAGLAAPPAGHAVAAVDAPPRLPHVFALHVMVDAARNRSTVDGRNGRFVPITGGTVTGPRLARGEPVMSTDYYVRTAPRVTVAEGPHGWLRRTQFVARGIRRPRDVQIQVFAVE